MKKGCWQCENGQHAFHKKTGKSEIVLVGTGKRAYLWIEWNSSLGREVAVAGGTKTLLALAKSIQENVR